MTISSPTRKAGPYSGNGVTTTFAFAFKVFEDEDITVVKTSASAVETTLELTTNYTVTRNADQDGDPAERHVQHFSHGRKTHHRRQLVGASTDRYHQRQRILRTHR
jgi:hypothetical protein